MSMCEVCGTEGQYMMCPACRDRIEGPAARIPKLEEMLADATANNARLSVCLSLDERAKRTALVTCAECNVVGGVDPEYCRVCTRGRAAEVYVQTLEDEIRDAGIECDRLTAAVARLVQRAKGRKEAH